MEYLGFWVTRTGIYPMNKKVQAIVNMKPPKNTKEVREFIWIVNYYRDIWAKRSHILHPLTALTSNKVKFKCTELEQKAFEDIKRAVSQDTLLVYPDFNQRFDIHTDASDYQLGSVISQNVKKIAFYSRKITGLKTMYTVTENKLQGIVKTFKGLRTILLGQKLKIYTDDKNLKCKNFDTDRILLWRVILEEYIPEIEYIQGNKNIVADALSRLPINGSQMTTHEKTYTTETMSEIYDIEELPDGNFPL